MMLGTTIWLLQRQDWELRTARKSWDPSDQAGQNIFVLPCWTTWGDIQTTNDRKWRRQLTKKWQARMARKGHRVDWGERPWNKQTIQRWVHYWQDRSVTHVYMHTGREKSLGEVIDLQGSSPPTSRTAKLLDLNTLEKCIYGNLGQGNPKRGYRQGNEWIESSPVEKDLGVLVDKTIRPIKVSLQPRKPTISSCIKRSVTRRPREVCPSLLCSAETPPGACCVRVVKGRTEFDVTQIYYMLFSYVLKHSCTKSFCWCSIECNFQKF